MCFGYRKNRLVTPVLKQLHVVGDISIRSGGLGLAALRYAQSVAKAGADVVLFVGVRTDDEIDFSTESINFRVISTEQFSSKKSNGLFSQFKALGAFITSNSPALVHIHGTWTPILAIASYLARARGIPVVVSPHGCLEPWALAHRPLKKRLALALYQRRVFSTAAMIVATANQELNSIRSMGFTNPIAVLPNGVDLSVIPKRTLGAVRKLLFLSRIHPKKGVLDLVYAWARVRRTGWKVVIAGPDEGGYLSEVQALIAKLNMQQDFEFPGLVSGDEKERCFSEADLFILPTYSENFGIVVAEALARQVPVITTTGAPWAELEKYDCGWWVEPGIDGIVGALSGALLISREQLAEMGARGRALVEDRYSWDRIGCDALHAYEWLLVQDQTRPDYIDLGS